jgi:hypothetical protein
MVWALCLTAASIVAIRAANDTGVTAAQINGAGQRQRASSRFGRLIITISASNSPSPRNTKENPMANAGDGHGIAAIQGNTAIFKPEGADADCRITLKFKRHNLVITQTNRCDLGKYANVDGTYKKVSTSKPVFRLTP